MSLDDSKVFEVAKEILEPTTEQSEVYSVNKTDPLLTEKQQLVTMIYHRFQEYNEWIATMPDFYRTGRLIG